MLKESWDIFVESVGQYDKLYEDRLLEREEKKEKKYYLIKRVLQTT